MGVYLTEDDEIPPYQRPFKVTTLRDRRTAPTAGHTPRLQASVCRNLSQFELDNVSIYGGCTVM